MCAAGEIYFFLWWKTQELRKYERHNKDPSKTEENIKYILSFLFQVDFKMN